LHGDGMAAKGGNAQGGNMSATVGSIAWTPPSNARPGARLCSRVSLDFPSHWCLFDTSLDGRTGYGGSRFHDLSTSRKYCRWRRTGSFPPLGFEFRCCCFLGRFVCLGYGNKQHPRPHERFEPRWPRGFIERIAQRGSAVLGCKFGHERGSARSPGAWRWESTVSLRRQIFTKTER
jgi:hypothetical protein